MGATATATDDAGGVIAGALVEAWIGDAALLAGLATDEATAEDAAGAAEDGGVGDDPAQAVRHRASTTGAA